MEAQQPLVSVIIPNYNHARYLEQRLDSVLNQTYQNFEVIILDDHSADNSLEVINSYKDNPHIKQIVVNETNSGSTFKQWDKGIHLAQGDIIWIAESDDYCELNMLDELVKAYTSQPNIVLAYAPVVFVNNEGEIERYYSKEGQTKVIKGKQYIVRYLAFENSIHNASCAIFSKQAAMAISKSYLNYSGVGDWWFWTLIAEKGDVVIVNKHLSYFRRHEGVVTSRQTSNGSNSRGYYELFLYIKKHYHISKIREDYILFSQPWIVQGTDDEKIREELKALWHYDRTYSKIECFCFRCLNHLRHRYLLYL